MLLSSFQFDSLSLSFCVLSGGCSYSSDLCSAFQDPDVFCSSASGNSSQLLLTNLTYVPNCVQGNTSQGVFYDGVMNKVVLDPECKLTCTAIDDVQGCEKEMTLQGNPALTNSKWSN